MLKLKQELHVAMPPTCLVWTCLEWPLSAVSAVVLMPSATDLLGLEVDVGWLEAVGSHQPR